MKQCSLKWKGTVRIFAICPRIFLCRDVIKADEQVGPLDAARKKISSEHQHGISDEMDLYVNIRSTIAKLLDVLGDMNVLSLEAHRATQFADLIAALNLTTPTAHCEIPIQELLFLNGSGSASLVGVRAAAHSQRIAHSVLTRGDSQRRAAVIQNTCWRRKCNHPAKAGAGRGSGCGGVEGVGSPVSGQEFR